MVQVFGAARPHHVYLFANRRGNRMKVLVHDGYGSRSTNPRYINRTANARASQWPDGQTGRARQSAEPYPPNFLAHSSTTGLLARVLVAKYADHLPLYRQENIFGRAWFALSRSTLAQWVGVCGMQLLPLVNALREAIFALRGILAGGPTRRRRRQEIDPFSVTKRP